MYFIPAPRIRRCQRRRCWVGGFPSRYTCPSRWPQCDRWRQMDAWRRGRWCSLTLLVPCLQWANWGLYSFISDERFERNKYWPRIKVPAPVTNVARPACWKKTSSSARSNTNFKDRLTKAIAMISNEIMVTKETRILSSRPTALSRSCSECSIANCSRCRSLWNLQPTAHAHKRMNLHYGKFHFITIDISIRVFV